MFLEVICNRGLPLLEFLPLLPITKAESWEVCTWGLAFIDWDLCYGFSNGLIFPELSLFKRLVFDLISCKCGVFFFAAFISGYFFFLYSYHLSHNVWALLHNRYFGVLSWEYSKVLGLSRLYTLSFSSSELRRDIMSWHVIGLWNLDHLGLMQNNIFKLDFLNAG